MVRGITALFCFLAMQPTMAVNQQAKTLTAENPMRRIITMLQDMQKEVEREGEAEKEIFEKALCACEGGEKELDKTIADSEAAIEEWTAKTDLSEATTLREKEIFEKALCACEGGEKELD